MPRRATALAEYRAKRDLSHTPEPSGGRRRSGRRPRFVIQQHQAILDAVKDRSPKAAAEAMRDHLRQTESDLRTVLQEVPKPEPKGSEA